MKKLLCILIVILSILTLFLLRNKIKEYYILKEEKIETSFLLTEEQCKYPTNDIGLLTSSGELFLMANGNIDIIHLRE